MAKTNMVFFKDADGLFQIDNKIYPKSKMTLEIVNSDTIEIDWLKNGRDNNPDDPFFKGKVTDIKDGSGTPYDTIANFKTTNKEFFQ